ncbi:MAG: phosphoribosyltransferase [Candidatus Eremiobacter antarcticus]|nr:phosphoribosyltransferase [Candidatus Eremiobacteraeota bacterium]MBC5808315.1 phosphoribosyltransferase [Candidatus Eremiobacteraeota bacterium]PZR63685.1 MAG: phosphoribosyltransferase [Candidatus Eremiobacter sp. RRmetagenome_bin22]
MRPPFLDRRAAGLQLAKLLSPQAGTMVLGVARGGALCAAAVAETHALPLDIIVVRKIGHPMQPELALGAVSSYGEAVTTEHAGGLSPHLFQSLIARSRREALSLETRLRGDEPALPVDGKPVIVVDDGIATSATMMCALHALRNRGATSITCAVPVAPTDSLAYLRAQYDRVRVLIEAPDIPFAVGQYYFLFGEVPDARVREELARFRNS